MCQDEIGIRTHVKYITQDLVLPNYVIGRVSELDSVLFLEDILTLEDELEGRAMNEKACLV